jgi:hypothetical protein
MVKGERCVEGELPELPEQHVHVLPVCELVPADFITDFQALDVVNRFNVVSEGSAEVCFFLTGVRFAEVVALGRKDERFHIRKIHRHDGGLPGENYAVV